MKKLFSLILTGSLMFTPLAAEEGEPLSIAETAAYTPDFFSTLTAALVTTDLAKTLNNDGPFTVFAPTNAAFDAAAKALLGDESASGLDLLLALDKETLGSILLYHVVPGKLLSGDVLAADSFTTANGEDIGRDGTTITGGQGSAGNLVLDLIDLEAANGVVHVIDGVLLPPVKEEPKSIVEIAAGNPAFTTLVAAIEKAGLVHILSSDKYRFTVFAPLNSAFDATAQVALRDENATGLELVEALSRWELRRILLNHLLWGERDSGFVLDNTRFRTLAWGRLHREDLTLFSRNGQGTLVPELIDIEATNGIIHVIDGVLLP
jgi:transforming growth factor-beta-induced protein